MKRSLVVLLTLLTFYYGKSQTLPCNAQDTLPTYDPIVVTMLDDAGKPVKDTIVGKILKTRHIFKPCREYIYKATYKTNKGALISSRLVSILATGKRWEHDTKQDEIVITYHKPDFEQTDIKKYYPNKAYANKLADTPIEVTGIIENEQEIWIHPFRGKEYHFTEVAPFPEIDFPLEQGRTWTSNLNIMEGWGDWENTTVHSEFTIVGKKPVTIAYKPIKEVWLIEANAEASFGKSNVTYWFHPDFGFVKQSYRNYLGQTLVFELVDVK